MGSQKFMEVMEAMFQTSLPERFFFFFLSLTKLFEVGSHLMVGSFSVT